MTNSTKKLTIIAIMSALAFVSVLYIRIPISPLPFLMYEPKDVIIAIAGFMFSPLTAFIISVIVSAVELFTISGATGIIGFTMNVIASCSFACTASYIYKRNKTIKTAVTGLIVGGLLSTLLMILWNWLLTPLYMGQPREDVIAILVPFILPFNLIKCGLNGILTMLIYKPLVRGLRKANLLPTT